MAARPTWKGFLKVSLVAVPVRVYPATDAAASLRFNQLHAECRTRIQQKKWCPTHGREVSKTEIVKGYEFEKGRYVVMAEEDLAKARPESTRVINLLRFVPASAIDPVHIERPYYLAPDGQMAADAFAVLREGMQGKAGIGKLALSGREYLVAVQPREQGMIMYTLRHAKEVRSMDSIDELAQVPKTVKAEEVKLARQVIGNFEGDLDLSEFRDEYQAEVRRIIDAKIAGDDVVMPVEEAPTKVVNLMDALRKSLDSVSRAKKPLAKAQMAKGAKRATARTTQKRKRA